MIGSLDPGQNEQEQRLIERIRREGTNMETISLFRDMILCHYRSHGRDLPWRRTVDPYSILVSEVMLQQTQVERVAAKYREFLERFPDFQSLARAPRRDVLEAWQGLGYNRRAIALHESGERVVEEYGGRLPADVETLATFPGIGKATASAICAYAFNMPVVYIETNIRRIVIHFFFHDRNDVRDSEILPILQQALYRENPREWYSALMDYGTILAKRTVNPNRRSAGYSRQSRFEGSDRQIRGQILSMVLSEGDVPEERMIRELSQERARVKRILKDLEKEGFIAESEGVYSCRE
ncbi:MAG: A/G-specific adenine glycosylase [Methanomicrobiaceae archaeon]|nr:A/G-specific adenine glycosylase [Methanomicrobiaceae archaeon]MDD5418529.1 A/G-specific adenine glycosylase [Methanomicrobiaceae archaeon]